MVDAVWPFLHSGLDECSAAFAVSGDNIISYEVRLMFHSSCSKRVWLDVQCTFVMYHVIISLYVSVCLSKPVISANKRAHNVITRGLTSKQSRGIFPTNISQPLAGAGLSDGQSGGGPYLRCPFSCTSGYPVRSRSAITAVVSLAFPAAGMLGGDATPVVDIVTRSNRSLVTGVPV